MKKITLEIPDRDERGVSPVIGVILMVAITVILAAVIASFVLGFGSQVSESVNAGADVSFNQASSPNSGTVDVTWVSQGNADRLIVHANATDGSTSTQTTLSSVGSTASLAEDTDIGFSDQTDHEVRVTVIAEKGDTRSVIQQETQTI